MSSKLQRLREWRPWSRKTQVQEFDDPMKMSKTNGTQAQAQAQAIAGNADVKASPAAVTKADVQASAGPMSHEEYLDRLYGLAAQMEHDFAQLVAGEEPSSGAGNSSGNQVNPNFQAEGTSSSKALPLPLPLTLATPSFVDSEVLNESWFVSVIYFLLFCLFTRATATAATATAATAVIAATTAMIAVATVAIIPKQLFCCSSTAEVDQGLVHRQDQNARMWHTLWRK